MDIEYKLDIKYRYMGISILKYTENMTLGNLLDWDYMLYYMTKPHDYLVNIAFNVRRKP